MVSSHIINFIEGYCCNTQQGGNGKETYRKLVFYADGDRLIGAVFISDINNVGLYRSVIRDHKVLNQFPGNYRLIAPIS